MPMSAHVRSHKSTLQETQARGAFPKPCNTFCVREASMSEQGWREFLAAEGVDDWVVLHGGATAVFRVPSLGEAAQLAGRSRRCPASRARGLC
jgi:hypothetical protein